MRKFFKSFKQIVNLSWQLDVIQVKFNKNTFNKQSTIELYFPLLNRGNVPLGVM